MAVPAADPGDRPDEETSVNAAKWLCIGSFLLTAFAARSADDRPATMPANEGPVIVPATRPSEPLDWLRREAGVIAREVGFTDRQMKLMHQRIDQLQTQQADWIRANGRQLEELAEKIRQARKQRDRKRIKALDVQVQPILAERDKLFGHEMDVVLDLMTDRQKVEYEAWILYRPVRRMFEAVNASDEQKARARQLCREAAPRRMKAASWREKTKVRKQVLRSALKEVLTFDQQVTYEAQQLERSAIWRFKNAKLTEKQKAEITALCRRIGKVRMNVENWRTKANLRRVMLISVYENILTDAQKKLVRKPRPPHRRRRRAAARSQPATSTRPAAGTQPAASTMPASTSRPAAKGP